MSLKQRIEKEEKALKRLSLRERFILSLEEATFKSKKLRNKEIKKKLGII
jgi:hypothetical protein